MNDDPEVTDVGGVIEIAGLLQEDFTEGERLILERLDGLETKINAMLAVFEQLSGVMDKLQGGSLLDLLRGR